MKSEAPRFITVKNYSCQCHRDGACCRVLCRACGSYLAKHERSIEAAVVSATEVVDGDHHRCRPFSVPPSDFDVYDEFDKRARRQRAMR